MMDPPEDHLAQFKPAYVMNASKLVVQKNTILRCELYVHESFGHTRGYRRAGAKPNSIVRTLPVCGTRVAIGRPLFSRSLANSAHTWKYWRAAFPSRTCSGPTPSVIFWSLAAYLARTRLACVLDIGISG